MAILRAGWHPYTFKRVKRDVDRLVARCERMWKRLKDWVRTGARNRPQPPRHFFARFLGQCRRSILQQPAKELSSIKMQKGVNI